MNEEKPRRVEGSNLEQLRSILDVLNLQLEQGELEEVLVFYTVKSSAAVQRTYSFKTGRTLNAISDQIEAWRFSRYAEQN